MTNLLLQKHCWNGASKKESYSYFKSIVMYFKLKTFELLWIFPSKPFRLGPSKPKTTPKKKRHKNKKKTKKKREKKSFSVFFSYHLLSSFFIINPSTPFLLGPSKPFPPPSCLGHKALLHPLPAGEINSSGQMQCDPSLRRQKLPWFLLLFSSFTICFGLFLLILLLAPDHS